jgi:hypothetical protein
MTELNTTGLINRLQLPKKEANRSLTLCLPQLTNRKLSLLAARIGRNKSAIIRLILDKALEDVEQIAQTLVVYPPKTVDNYQSQHRASTFGGKRRYQTPSNIEGFLKPDSDWHAYWLGFIAADGCIHRGNGNCNLLRIRLKSEDRSLLENFKDGLKIDNPIREFINDGKPYTQIEINDKFLVNILSQWGIVENKTLSLIFPSISTPYLSSFIRGYFDGDGTVYWRHRKYPTYTSSQIVCRFISGSLNFLSRLAEALTEQGIRTRSLYKNGNSNAYVLPLSSVKSNISNFASFIYQDASVFLSRKRSQFDLLCRGFDSGTDNSIY